MVAIAAHDADVLVHEATFGHDEAARAQETGHSTAREAAELARDAGVRMLALTHVSPPLRAAVSCATRRARVFAASEVPRDFDTIEVPFPEKGEPELVRWPGHGAPAAAPVAP